MGLTVCMCNCNMNAAECVYDCYAAENLPSSCISGRGRLLGGCVCVCMLCMPLSLQQFSAALILHSHAHMQRYSPPLRTDGGKVQMQTNGLVVGRSGLLETLLSNHRQHQQHTEHNKYSDACLATRTKYSTSTLTRWNFNNKSLKLCFDFEKWAWLM